MARKGLVIGFSMIAAASPILAANPEPSSPSVAPAGTADTKYCLRVEAFTGSRIETIRCWTREKWAEQGVDVDKEWAKEGVATKG